MATADRRTGGCLCGAVTYEATLATDEILHCHCGNCRRLTGNFTAAVRAITDELRVEGPGLAWHELGYARYGFCQHCGSTLFYRAADREDVTPVMVGTLDDASGLHTAAVWYAEEAQAHHTLPDVAHHGADPV